ncbi:uncharacterized protein LOC135480609 isoform X2 [Liolophura sinensis]
MGQSSSILAGGDVYVPVYKRPKWPNEDWFVAMEIRDSDSVMGREIGFQKSEFEQMIKRLKKACEKEQMDAHLRQRLQDLVNSMKTKHNVNSLSPKSSPKDRLQRTFSNLRSFRRSRSPTQRSNQAVMRSKSHECSPKSPLLEKERSQRVTVHQFDLSTVTNPVPVEESTTTPQSVCRKSLANVVRRMREAAAGGENMHTCDDVNRMAEDTQWFLQRTYKAFKDVQILVAGSIADGTKIISPDEFDLVVLLPSLEQSVKEISVLEDTQNEYIRLGLVYDQHDVDNGDQFRDAVSGESGEHLIITVLDAMKSFLRPGWTFVSAETKTFVTRIHLTQEASSDKVEVRFDISLALPISCNKVLPLIMDNPDDVIKLPLWNHLVATLQKYDKKVFALVPGEASGKTRRISLALAEKDQLLQYGEFSGVVECLCYCKTLVALFFPLVLVNDSWEPCVPPYLLKNAIFFLMEHYNDREKWLGNEPQARVVEVFMLLGKSLWPDGFGTRGSRISLFVFPGFTSFPEFCNDSCRFDPTKQEIRDSLAHSYMEGKACFPCKFQLKNELDALLQVPEISQVLGKYAEKLQTSDWKFRELLVDLVDLLKNVLDYSGNTPWSQDEANNNSSPRA